MTKYLNCVWQTEAIANKAYFHLRDIDLLPLLKTFLESFIWLETPAPTLQFIEQKHLAGFE